MAAVDDGAQPQAHSAAEGATPRLILWGAGVILIGLCAAITFISSEFTYGGLYQQRPVLLFVALLAGAGAVYCAGAFALRNTVSQNGFNVASFLLIGAAMRAFLFPSQPILEDDYYRYLWDGAVLAHGYNPYAHIPGKGVAGTAEDTPQALQQIASESGEIIGRVNHSHLSTVYPPVGQAAFAIAHWLQPWSLTAWRIVIFAFDAATVLLLILLLRRLELPPLYAALYWCNPLLVKELYNSSHMDIVALPLVLAALLFAVNAQPVRSGAALALAVGAKVWPVLLLPLLMRPWIKRPGKLIALLASFAILGALLFLPVTASFRHGDQSGFFAYGRTWQMNDAFFMSVLWLVDVVSSPFDLSAEHAQLLARLAVAVVLLAGIAYWSWTPPRDGSDLCSRALYIIVAAFLLSPTQFPWYFVWFLPLLAIQPRSSLLLFTALLPLYYLRFYFEYRGNTAVFDYGIVWIEFVPVWFLLLWEWYSRRRRNAAEMLPA